MAQIYVRFECGREERMMEKGLGPFEFVQMTYDELRISPNGDPFAYFGKDGDWHLVDETISNEPWSDFVIYSE